MNETPTPPPVDTMQQQGPSQTQVRCRQCGYNLTGVVIGSNCPECGTSTASAFGAIGQPTSGFAIASLVLGIVSIPGSCFYAVPGIVCGILAIIFSTFAKKQADAGGFSENTRGLAKAGMICGIIGLSITGVFIVFFAIMVLGMGF